MMVDRQNGYDSKKTNRIVVHDREPRVSIGLPVYNGEAYLGEAIDSVLAQTFTDFELIISDNASTDGTEQICREYASRDPRVRYYRNDENLGAARNFNRVFELSSGEYFKWIAADNSLEPQFLEKCVGLLDSDPASILAYSHCKQRNEYRKTVRTIDIDYDLAMPNTYERIRNLISFALGMHIPVWGLIRRVVLKDTHLVRSFVGADDCLLVELILKGKFDVVPEHLIWLRTHSRAFHAIRRSGKGRGRAAVEEARWFDPKSKGRITTPSWRRLREFAVSTIRSSESFKTKIRILIFLLRLAMSWRKSLLEEIWISMKNIMRLQGPAKTANG